jgi:hypothetical protein
VLAEKMDELALAMVKFSLIYNKILKLKKNHFQATLAAEWP